MNDSQLADRPESPLLPLVKSLEQRAGELKYKAQRRRHRKWNWHYVVLTIIAVVTLAGTAVAASGTQGVPAGAIVAVTGGIAAFATRLGLQKHAIQAEKREADYEFVEAEAQALSIGSDLEDADLRARLRELNEIIREAGKTFWD